MPKDPSTAAPAPPAKSLVKGLAHKLAGLQREADKLGIPSLVVIEGLDASSKGQILNQILLEIDSRSFKVYSTHASQKEPRRFPLLHRFWNNTPAKGTIQFYDRGPYYLVIDAWAEGKLHEEDLPRYWDEIAHFERQLADSGVNLVKLFLRVGKKTQAKRLQKLESNPKTSWRVTSKDWKRHQQYPAYLDAWKRAIDSSNQGYAPWREIDTGNMKAALVQAYEHLIDRLQAAIDKAKAAPAQVPGVKRVNEWIPYKGRNYLADIAFPRPLQRDEYKAALKAAQGRIHELAHEIHYHQVPAVVVFCGWDAAGKGGCIKRLVQSMDPRGYEVIPIAAPNPTELAQHYLWRFWKKMPHRGKIAIFDRSWYGRVMVERVEGFCSNAEWQAAYTEINEMEAHLSKFGTKVIKFWLHIDKQTQLQRFKDRENTPFKNWKITSEDWRNREKWELYEESVNEMIQNTDTKAARWNIIPANCKLNARVAVLNTVIDGLSKAIESPARPPL